MRRAPSTVENIIYLVNQKPMHHRSSRQTAVRKRTLVERGGGQYHRTPFHLPKTTVVVASLSLPSTITMPPSLHPIPAFLSALPVPLSTPRTSSISTARRQNFSHPPIRHTKMTSSTPSPPPPPPPTPETLLIRSAMMCDPSGVRAALDAGAPANHAALPSGMTALMWSASEGDLTTAQLLLDAALTSADVNAKTDTGYTAMLYAFEGLPNANPRPPPPPGFPMDPARRNKKVTRTVDTSPKITGHASIAKLLLMKGADIGVVNPFGEGLLSLAARKGQTEWVRLLDDKGGGVRSASLGYKQTALHISAMENQADCVKYLLEAGAEIDAKNVVGWSPLMWASATGAVECVRALVDAGADVNLTASGTPKDDGTETVTNPLKEARRCVKAKEVSMILIRAGALE